MAENKVIKESKLEQLRAYSKRISNLKYAAKKVNERELIIKCLHCEVNKVSKRNKKQLCKPCYIKSYCKQNRSKYRKCYPLKDKRRRKNLKNATPIWLNTLLLREIHVNCPANFHVDHIIPLNNKNVCGLNVPWNLQYLSKEDNMKKWNHFDFTYENEQWKKL